MSEAAVGPDSVQAAPGVTRSEAEAVNKRERRELYKKHEKIYPKKARGTFRNIKWIVMAVTLAIYYLAPWIRWDRGPNAPDQAILIDFPSRRFYFFFIEIWPQEVYYITGLLIIAAVALFLVTSLAGRVWCGYTCPQTVWTDLFIAVERLFEGDRAQRIRLDKMPFSWRKAGRKVAKHAVWLVIAVLTGGAWVFYFADAPTLAAELVRFEAPAIAYMCVAGLTFTTYLLGGIAREQVCTYMCPWPRIQAAMLDEDSLTVTYRDYRGEPRGPRRKNESAEGKGDCIACNQCVAVCPMGIDIRDGQQLECIGCALCIDACNDVMERVGLPRNLIAYDTYSNVERKARGEKPRMRLWRPRTIIYAAIIVLVSAIMLFTLATRAELDVNVLRDRNPLFVKLGDGDIRNAYTVKILNKLHDERSYSLEVEGLEGSRIDVIGLQGDGAPVLTAKPDSLASYRVLVTAPWESGKPASIDIEFILQDLAGEHTATYESVFRGPAQ